MTTQGPTGGGPDLTELIASVLTALQEEEAALDARAAAEAEADAEADEARARAARSGALGPDWQAVQQRVDLHLTTLADVFSGVDTTPQARALREASTRRLADLHDEWQAQDEDAAQPEPSPARVVRGAAGASERHRQEIAEQIQRDLRR